MTTNSGKSWSNSSASGYNTPEIQAPIKSSNGGYRYRCKITDNTGNVVYSAPAQVKHAKETWTNTYDANGMRTQRKGSSATYSYIYNGSQLTQMTYEGNTLYFAYDAAGTPMSVTYNGTTYYYATNLQGDITAILNTSGTAVVTYTYDAWGNPLAISGSLASTLGTHNPLRYRGYVYDTETGLYYLQSRYYDPEVGRFINADAFTTTGQGLLGNNMFAYCNNNPVMYTDSLGLLPLRGARDLLEKWIFGDGDEYYFDEKDKITKSLKESQKMESYVEGAIETAKGGQPVSSGHGEFTSSDDGWDLYLSTQHFNYTITVEKQERTRGMFKKRNQVRYVAVVVVSDTYNFDEIREWNGIGNILNNGAFIAHGLGFGNDYEWFATYTYTTKWEDV